jgi:N-acetylmuramoyl-L-alanine amidase
MKMNFLKKKYFLFFSLLPGLVFGAQNNLTKIEIVKSGDYSRVILKVSVPTIAHVFTLAHPDRLVVDLPDTHFKADIKHLDFSNSGISGARIGWPKPSTLRIVFDLSTPARVKNFMANENNEPEVVVDVHPKNSLLPQVTFTPPQPVPAPVITKVVTKTVDASQSVSTVTMNHEHTAELRKLIKPQIVESNKPRQFVIVVDAGHGGKDPGTIGLHGTKEKDVVLAIALRLADLINQEPNMHAALTRRGDYFVTLQDRLRLARSNKADLFIAIHADSYFTAQMTGASVYALSRHGASSMTARWLADHDNHSELGGVDLNGLGDHSYVLRSVLIDLAQTATIVDSLRLGTEVLSSLGSVAPLHYTRVEQAPFMVLKSPDIPSILVETGFLSTQSEEERLRDPEYRERLAHALLNGIRRYVATHPVMASTSQSSEIIFPV